MADILCRLYQTDHISYNPTALDPFVDHLRQDTILPQDTRFSQTTYTVARCRGQDHILTKALSKCISLQTRFSGSREKSIRLLRQFITTNITSSKSEFANSPLTTRRTLRISDRLAGDDMPATDFLRHSNRASAGNAAQARLNLPDEISNLPANDRASRTASAVVPEQKPVASGNGVSVSISLAEPVLFLQGFDQNDTSNRSTAMLRGSLHLKVAKSTKLKAISLKFKGTAVTSWPEGIPPKKLEFQEVDTLMSHTWPFFNAQFPSAEDSTGADVVQLSSTGQEKHGLPYLTASPQTSSVNLATSQSKRLSLQHNHSQSLEKLATNAKGSSVNQKGYRTFHPGDYIYNFELPLDSRLPETISVELGSVKYELEASVERAGAFRTNLLGSKEVVLIRAPSEGSLEQVEPIAISRNWEDQLHYNIVISGKSFPLGAKVPIAFKLTPLAKVQCHRIKVFVTENTEYFCSNKRVHRMEPTRKIQLFEKRADGPSSSTFPGSSMRVTSGGGVPYDQRVAAARGEEVLSLDTSNLLGRLDGDSNIGPTEMELNVQLPGCQQTTDKDRSNKLHFDTTHTNIQVHHWIKIVMRLSKPDATDPTKRRHFEISIDSPFHILSCRASQANTALPAYSSPENADAQTSLADCGCPGAPRQRISPTHVSTLNALNQSRAGSVSTASSDGSGLENGQHATGASLPGSSLTRPAMAHTHTNTPAIQRPIHMLRAPSFNPPAFEDEQPPPPLVTPPPEYNDIASPSSGLTDYFSRLADTYDENDSEDERGNGRVRVPLTPGSRVNRSMDLPRSWVPLAGHT